MHFKRVIFINLIIFILIKHIPILIIFKYEYLPELLSIIIYASYSFKKKLLSKIDILVLAVLNDALNLSYIGSSMIQYCVYMYCIDIFRRKYNNYNLYIEWAVFCAINLIVLPIQYFIYNSEILYHNYTIKIAITFLFFPIILYMLSISKSLSSSNYER
ncbi:MAG: cell shape-determining protein MreD [Candidatus Midichloriaceae bacterium]|jgi:cell shape-determining protein MreD